MQRYFFHFRSGSTYIKDTSGAVLSPSQVMDAALKIVENMTMYRQYLCDWADGVLRVEDERGEFLAILSVPSLFAYGERATVQPPAAGPTLH